MKISAVLLAGGESRRFGQDKATFVFDGKPLWKRQLDTLAAVQPDELFVSARTDPSWRPNEIGFVQDAPPSRGPISGLVAAFSAMSGSHLLALAIDLPFMTSDCLRWLAKQIDPRSGIVPVVNGKLQPLVAIYPSRAAGIFEEGIKGPDWSLKSGVHELTLRGMTRDVDVPPENWRLFDNINRPQDLRRAEGSA
jgi:molybdopterin-guanine dinucleotide biosynthesis protein A